MKKKKVILFMPTIEIGGVEKNFVLIANFLSTKFNNLTLVTLSKTKRGMFAKNINFVTLSLINTSKFSRRIKFLIGLIMLTKEIIKQNNTVVVAFQANLYCVYLCKLLRTKVVIRSNSSPTGWSNNFIKKIFYKHALNAADRVIVNSKEFKKLLMKKFNVKSHYIYNPLNKDEIIKLSKKKIKLPFFDKKSLKFICVARLEDQKDHKTMLEAFSMIKDKFKFNLLLIGNGKNEGSIKNFIKEKNLTHVIKIVKNIKNPYPYILKSNIFVLSSVFEGLPNVLLEAIVLNKFIISSDCPSGPKEILSYGKGGQLFKTKSPMDLYRQLINLEKPSERQKKINYSKKMLFRFDSKKNLNKYLNLINSISI